MQVREVVVWSYLLIGGKIEQRDFDRSSSYLSSALSPSKFTLISNDDFFLRNFVSKSWCSLECCEYLGEIESDFLITLGIFFHDTAVFCVCMYICSFVSGSVGVSDFHLLTLSVPRDMTLGLSVFRLAQLIPSSTYR